jgi:hypothetical protein
MAIASFQSYLPGVSVDCVLFGFHEGDLKVLMLKLKNVDLWSLPGGFIHTDQDADDAAVQVLKERTGLSDIYLQQFYTFTSPDRHDAEHAQKLVDANLIDEEGKKWFDRRFVTVGYLGLVDYNLVGEPQPDEISETCEWRSIHDLPSLMLDHKKIVKCAFDNLKYGLNSKPIGINLLPEKFTLPELQLLYETILEKKLDRRNFRRKILGYDILLETDEKRVGGSHKAPRLYTFDTEKYHAAIREGFKSAW